MQSQESQEKQKGEGKQKSQKRRKSQKKKYLKKNISTQYDLELAIKVAQFDIVKELPDWEKSLKEIYHPTQEFLKDLASQKPRFLLCFWGEMYSYQKPNFAPKRTGLSADLYIVSPQNKVVYLGTVLDRKESYILWRWFLENFPNQRDILKKRGPMTIVRQKTKCRIPTNCPQLNRQAFKQAVRKYMKVFCPSLVNLPIKWLSEQKRKILLIRIYQEAEKRAEKEKGQE